MLRSSVLRLAAGKCTWSRGRSRGCSCSRAASSSYASKSGHVELQRRKCEPTGYSGSGVGARYLSTSAQLYQSPPATGVGAGKVRHSIDIRSCLLAECFASEAEQLRATFQSGADAVALDVFALAKSNELVAGLAVAASAIEQYAPSYQMHFIQVNANLTRESPLIASVHERQAKLASILQDIATAVESKKLAICGLLLRNVQEAGDVQVVQEMLTKYGRALSNVRFIVSIESPMSYFAALQIAESSPQNIAMIASSPMLAKSTECRDDSENETVMTVKTASTVAAHAVGLVSLCGWHNGDEDPSRLSRLATEDRIIGFDGKVIAGRPDLVPLVNHLYSVQDLEISLAEELVGIDGGTTRTEKHPDTGRLTIQDSEARRRQFKGPPHRAMSEATLHKRHLQKPKIEEDMKLAQERSRLEKPEFLTAAGVDYITHERLQVGDTVRCPYEITVHESWITLWQMLVYNPRTAEFSVKHQNRFGSSRPILPFSLSLLLCVSMSVARLTEKARFHLGLQDCVMVRPLEAGDTFRSFFRVDSKTLMGSKYPVIDTTHVLVNQDDKLMFSARKKTMFPAEPSIPTDENFLEIDPNVPRPESYVRRHLMSKTTAELTAAAGSHQPVLTQGQVIVHQMVRCIDKSECMFFCNMCKLTNDFHTNYLKYDKEQILVPGPMVMYTAISNSLPDLGEPLYHEMDLATHINKFNPGDAVGTITYISDVKPVLENAALEEVTLKQIGVKNVDMQVLLTKQLPRSLFASDLVKPSVYEQICREHCPELQRRIVVNVVRRVIRVKPSAMQDVYSTIHRQEDTASIQNTWFV